MFISQSQVTGGAVVTSKKGRIQEGKLVEDGEPGKIVFHREASDEEGGRTSKV